MLRPPPELPSLSYLSTPGMVAGLLREARDMIGSRGSWVQGDPARDSRGFRVNAADRTACSWCATGALFHIGVYRAYKYPSSCDISVLRDLAVQVLAYEVDLPAFVERELSPPRIVEGFNDSEDTSHDEVLLAFDTAINKLEDLMLRPSPQLLLALDIVVDLAKRSTPSVFVQRHDMAERLGLVDKPRHLGPMLQLLVHNSIIRSRRGPLGGYRLMDAYAHRTLTVGDVVGAVETVYPSGRGLPPVFIGTQEDAFFDTFNQITIHDYIAENEE